MTDFQFNNYDLELLRKSICDRLDGHGADLKFFREELKDIRNDLKDIRKDIEKDKEDILVNNFSSNEKLREQLETAKEKCSERHNQNTAKIIGTSSFISGVITALGIIFKSKLG